MENFTTEQLKNALIMMGKMKVNPDIASAFALTCDELEKRMGEESFYTWFDTIEVI